MIRVVLTSFVLLLTLTSVAFGQFTFNYSGSGARAQGMGNAFIAVSDDASAVAWNPAGLVAHEGPMLGLSWSNMAPRGKTSVGGSDWDATGSFSSIQQGAFAAPIRISGHRFVGSIGYSGNIEEYLNTGSVADVADFMVTETYTVNTIEFEETFETHLRQRIVTEYHSNVNSINAGFGTQVRDNLSMGIAVNIYTGRGVSSSVNDVDMDPYYPINYYPQAVFLDQLTVSTDSIGYSGYNFTLGLKLDGEKFDVGLVMRTPFELKAELDRTTVVTTTFNGTVQQTSGTRFDDKHLIKYELPWFIGLGGAYQVSPKLLLAADFEYRGFSGNGVKVRNDWEANSDLQGFEAYDMEWFDCVALRGGMEYVTETESRLFPVVPLRLGFSYVGLPFSGADVSATRGEEGVTVITSPRIMSDQASAMVFSGGIGVRWSQIHLDLVYQFTSADYVFDLYPGLPEDFEPPSIENRDHKFSLNFTGYF